MKENILRGIKMETEKLSADEEDEDVSPPGFRFHPTDEELVGFYLKRKVEKKPLRIDLIKHIDIYKFEPWDLPKEACSVGEREWYFFCRRGRKYKNSIRPNRVTGYGFWKATGIDRPIYSAGKLHDCIGLKKSLVYYRGSAGKGTKTDWMMHEFRLPPTACSKTTSRLSNNNNNNFQEAEVWTLCRIFKREAPGKRYASEDWRKCISSKQISGDTSSITSFSTSDVHRHNRHEGFGVPADKAIDRKPVNDCCYESNQLLAGQLRFTNQAPFMASYLSFSNQNGDEYLRGGNWDELRPMVEYALEPTMLYNFW